MDFYIGIITHCRSDLDNVNIYKEFTNMRNRNSSNMNRKIKF